MALLRAVWTIHALGKSGMPVDPTVERRHERVLRDLFGKIEIADLTDEGRDDAAPVGPVDPVNRLGDHPEP